MVRKKQAVLKSDFKGVEKYNGSCDNGREYEKWCGRIQKIRPHKYQL